MEKKIKPVIGSQNFEKSTINIEVNGQIITCRMWFAESGDICFTYDNNDYYLYEMI